MPKKEVRVIKVPVDRVISEYPQDFPKMPRLYLELLENKGKIKQDLINKEHNPESLSPSNEISHEFEENAFIRRKSNDNINEKWKSESDEERFNRNKSSRDEDERFDRKKSSRDEDERFDRKKSSRDEDERFDRKKSSRDEDERFDRKKSSRDDDDDDEDDHRKKSTRDDDNSDIGSIEEDNETKSNFSYRSSENLSVRLKDLLDDVSDINSEDSFNSRRENFSKNNDKYTRKRDDIYNRKPPTLGELQKRGAYTQSKELRDINNTTISDVNEEDKKREMLFKFDLLRKSYPTAIIPEYNIHTDYQVMVKSYEDCVRRLSLDSSVETYKTYLVYGFMGCEFVFGNFLKFDMEGFTQQQILNMNSYEKLLIELGEKSYVPSGSKWPVEVRLFFVVIMNAAFFIVSKMIMKKTGSNIMNMLNNMNSKVQQTTSVKKPRMKGPNIDMSDMPDIEQQSSSV